MSDIRQTKEWAEYLTNLGWAVEKLGQNYVHIKRIPLFGSYMKIPRPSWPLNLGKIDSIAHQNHTLAVKITPKVESDSIDATKIHNQLIKHGYIKEYWTLTVVKTMILDLTETEDDLLKSFHKKTRQYINLAKRNGINIIQSDNINLAYRLYRQSALRNNFKPLSFKNFSARFKVFHASKMALLLLAQTKNNQSFASLLVLLNPQIKEAVTSLAGMSKGGGKMRASYLIYWEALLLCKKLGYKKFDFDGIADERYRIAKIMKGATFFKRGFRGREVTYIGSYLKWYNPLFKFLFSLITKIAYR